MLKQLTGGRFFNLKFQNEIDYWRSLGGTGNTVHDAMISYLNGAGYTGTDYDALNSFLKAQNGADKGTIVDNALAFVGP